MRSVQLSFADSFIILPLLRPDYIKVDFIQSILLPHVHRYECETPGEQTFHGKDESAGVTGHVESFTCANYHIATRG
jgi:hypothetical protein